MVNQTWPPPVETDTHLLSGVSVVSSTRMFGGRSFRSCGFQGEVLLQHVHSNRDLGNLDALELFIIAHVPADLDQTGMFYSP